jgi:hypothetical protein
MGNLINKAIGFAENYRVQPGLGRLSTTVLEQRNTYISHTTKIKTAFFPSSDIRSYG